MPKPKPVTRQQPTPKDAALLANAVANLAYAACYFASLGQWDITQKSRNAAVRLLARLNGKE